MRLSRTRNLGKSRRVNVSSVSERSLVLTRFNFEGLYYDAIMPRNQTYRKGGKSNVLWQEQSRYPSIGTEKADRQSDVLSAHRPRVLKPGELQYKDPSRASLGPLERLRRHTFPIKGISKILCPGSGYKEFREHGCH
jgi:hypothetical protein